MKIINLEIENVKRIRVLAIKPDPKAHTVVISGKNDQGKTTTLDSIEYVLGGKQAVCEEPIRKGQTKARIFADFGEFTAERTFTNGESKIVVRGKDGRPKQQPQTYLDQLYATVAFEPLKFVRMKSDEQVETLRKLVGLDFTELNAKRQKAYDDREAIGRDLRTVKAKLSEHPFDESAPVSEVSVSGLMVKLTEAQKVNRAIEGAKSKQRENVQRKEQLEAEADRMRFNVDLLKKQLKEAEDLLTANATDTRTLASHIARSEGAINAMVAADEATIQKQIQDSEATNVRVRANLRHQEIQTQITETQTKYDKLTFDIDTIDQDKSDQLAWATMPLEGLSFDDRRVLLNGVPFSQGSQARQLQAAVAIGLALNPKIKVILIRDASLLDDDSMKLMADIAQKNDAQIWLEVVNSKDPAAVVIEDGEVKA